MLLCLKLCCAQSYLLLFFFKKHRSLPEASEQRFKDEFFCPASISVGAFLNAGTRNPPLQGYRSLSAVIKTSADAHAF